MLVPNSLIGKFITWNCSDWPVRPLFLSLALMLSSCTTLQEEAAANGERPIEVMVVATMHGGHADNPRYSYEDFYSLVTAFNPDLVGTEIRQEDFDPGEEYLARNYPCELALRYSDRIVGLDWLGEDLEGQPVPENYWRDQSEIIRLQRQLEQDDTLRSPVVEAAQARQKDILATATAASLNDGRYDLATSAYYSALAEILEGPHFAPLTEFYAERDRRISQNALATLIHFRKMGLEGGRVLFAVGADHRGPLVKMLKRRLGDDIRLVPVP